VVDRIITELGVFDITPGGVAAVEIAPDVTHEDIRTRTGCHVHLSGTRAP